MNDIGCKVTIEMLLKAGVHLGHKSCRWHPSMAKFICCKRNKTHYINVEKTRSMFKRALRYIGEVVLKGSDVLFVCTNPQLSVAVREELKETGMPFVVSRWLGGTLTNYSVTKRGPSATKPTQARQEQKGPAKNIKLGQRLTEGPKLKHKPAVLFLIGVERHQHAVREAKKIGVPVIAIVDTNSSVKDVAIPIPGNDDSTQASLLYVSVVARYIREIRKRSSTNCCTT